MANKHWKTLAQIIHGLLCPSRDLPGLRSLVEFFRVADAQFITPDNPLGHVIGGPAVGLSMGQLLSLPMVLIGLFFLLRARQRPVAA